MSVLIQVVIPIFAIILCGFLAGRFSLIPSSGTFSLNQFVYYFALPALLFLSISTAPVSQLINTDFILANISILFSCILLTFIIFALFFKKRFPELSLYGMITTYGNTGYLGIPLLVAAFGQDGALPAALVTLIYDLVIILIVVGTFEIGKARGRNNNGKKGFILIFGKSVLLNPINASLLFGIVFALFRLPIPEPIHVFAEVLGPAAGPTALFALGLGLSREKSFFRNNEVKLAEFVVLMSLKLIVLPLLAMFFVFFVFQIEDQIWAISIIILSALPSGATIYVFAEKYNTLVKQVPIYILASTVISIVTLTIFLIIML